MVLDSGDEVYVWVGQGSDEQEKEKAFTMAEVSLALVQFVGGVSSCKIVILSLLWFHLRLCLYRFSNLLALPYTQILVVSFSPFFSLPLSHTLQYD